MHFIDIHYSSLSSMAAASFKSRNKILESYIEVQTQQKLMHKIMGKIPIFYFT